mgnify:CR=1 FL=1
MWNIFENPPKVCPKSFQNQPKTFTNQEKCVLGAFSAPNRAQVGSRAHRPKKRTTPFSSFWRKMSLQGSLLGPQEIRESAKNRTIRHGGALGPSKNGLGEGFLSEPKNQWKKIEKNTKNHGKMGSKFIEKLILFRTCDSLFFAKSPTFK